jgi:hypothetical protein
MAPELQVDGGKGEGGDKVTTPYQWQCWFFIESSPIYHAGEVQRFRFSFDEYGPRIELVNAQNQSAVIQTFGLQPEDYWHITSEDLQVLIQIFQRSIAAMDPQVFFTNVPRASGIVGA